MASNDDLLRPGAVVETTFGVGVVIHQKKPEDGGMVGVRLWRMPGHSIGTSATAYLQPQAILKCLPVAPGMTTMTIEAIPKKVLVHNYLSSQQKYLVSYADEEDAAAVAAILPHLRRMMMDEDNSEDEFFDAEEEGAEQEEQIIVKKEQAVLLPYSVDQLAPCKAAKFYPLLLELMKRGDRAAAQIEGLWIQNKDKIQDVTEKLVKTGEQVGAQVAIKGQELLKENDIQLDAIVDIDKNAEQASIVAEKAVENLKVAVQSNAPSQEQVKKVMTMLKDEELTVLIENGKQRLEQLVQSDIPKATQEALNAIGIQWKETTGGNEKLNATQQKALKAVEDLLHSIQQAAAAQGIDIPADTLSLKGLNLKQLEAQFQEFNLEEKFQVMFDSFVTASKSDRHLSTIMEHVAQHTTEWQQMTGRLLATKSGSLFLEGASRIQQRAGLILSGGKGPTLDFDQWTQSMTTKFTKAFTEGDAAVARLKSIELGDAVRQRLVSAIEIRSDSLGGLDGIIARALGAVESSTKKTAKSIKKQMTQNNISAMLTSLQTSATSKRKEAHETLISVLSRKSVYRDIALLKLERTFCDLETQFFGASWNSEDAWSAEDLVKLARGEGGTAALFEPIAKRAKQEIDNQLDIAEGHVRNQIKAKGAGNDQNAELVLEALTRVRKIMSGELTMNAIVEDVVTLLNDDKIVRVGEDLVQRGERVLDALEGVQNMNGDITDPTNKLINEAMEIAKKAGITKDSVMKELEKLDVDEILDTAQGAITDEKKRLQILSQATDAALDFFLKILPSMPVPPFDGVKDGLVYHLSNLSMEGFKVKKENIVVEIAGMRATTDANKRKSVMSMKSFKDAAKNLGPAATAGTPLSAPDSGSSLLDESSAGDISFESQEEELAITNTEAIGRVKATELLIIDISDISAVLDGANWSFEQTYFPYLKGNGVSNVRLAEGSVRLQFELRKRKRKMQVAKVGGIDGETEEKEIWEPVLCLHDRNCEIGEVFVSLQGEGRLAWLLNKLSVIFKGPVGTYVARQIVAVLSNKSGFILDKLNNVLSPYWDLILSTAGLKMDELVETDHRVVTTADSEDNEKTIELVWRERLPLGLNLLLNDESGQVKVVDLPRGSQARKVCEARNLNPEMFRGATIVAVNGCRLFEPEEVYDALRDPIRPKTILFELAELEEAQRVEEFVADAMNEKAQKIKDSAFGQASEYVGKEERTEAPKERSFQTRIYDIMEPGDLGIEFCESTDSFGLSVCGFVKKEDGTRNLAEESGKIKLHDLLTHINGQLVLGENGAGRDKAFQILQSEGSVRPLKLEFTDPYLILQVFDASPTDITANLGGPAELCLEEIKPEGEGAPRRILLSGFNDTAGVAETSGILIGDYLVFINGKSVGAGSRWLGEGPSPTLEDVYEVLRDPANYPMGLTFARPSKGGDTDKNWTDFMKGGSSASKDGTALFNDDQAETVAVSTERWEMLGCVFDVVEGSSDVVVTDFYAIPGFFQTQLQSAISHSGRPSNAKLAIESINGQFVPSYASKDIVMNAMKRSWARTRRVELLLCDDECKAWVFSQLSSRRQVGET